MLTIKNISLKILFLILLLSVFFSCDAPNKEPSSFHKNPYEITFISVSDIGGNLGDYRIIKVIKDSIFAEKGMTANQTHKEWKSAINTATWEKLTSSVNIVDLDYIKSSLSRQSAGEKDETFQIRTPEKFHIYVNAYVDTMHYKQLQQLKKELYKILPKEYQ